MEPSAYYFRSVLRFETAAPALDWLNRVIAVATGARRLRQVELAAFEIT